MYSKNDYRYYLENQLIHSDDFLAHYGVKGMKWHKRKLKNPLAPKNQKVEVTDLKNEKTGEVYKSSKKKVKKSKNPLAPKNQKVEVITNKKKKRSKKEANWNKQMQQYGREILSERKR